MIAAVGNMFGVVGVATAAELVPIKSFNKEGEALTSTIVSGIDWAIQNEINVLNMSFGTSEPSLAMF